MDVLKWKNLRRKDKIKLIYAYVISPIWIILSISGEIMSEVYRKYGAEVFRRSKAFSEANYVGLRIGVLTYLPVILPPTIMRFVFPRREFKYGIEIYCYMLLCMFLTRILLFLTIGEVVHTLRLLDSLVIYCVLSYKITEYYNIPRMYRNTLTFITLGVSFIMLYITSGRFTNSGNYLFPLWEAIVLCVVLNTCKKEDKSNWASSQQRHEETKRNFGESPNPNRNADHSQSESRFSMAAERLVNIGLAHIGRKTKTTNPCITPEQTAERQRIERPFLKLLSDNYEDAATRKMLSQYFMLYKEMLLFVIYAMVLRKNPLLHTEVKGKLVERLTEGVPPESVKLRNQYWRELSRHFYESDKGTQDIGQVLEEVFWGKLPKKVSPIPKCGRDSLRAIFNHAREAIVQGLH